MAPARLRWCGVLFVSMAAFLLAGTSTGRVQRDDLKANPTDLQSPTGQSPKGSELHESSPVEVDSIEAVQFEPKRGFYSGPVTVRLSCPTAEVIVRFTTDGSEPTVDHGRVYTEPLRITATAAVRAVAGAPSPPKPGRKGWSVRLHPFVDVGVLLAVADVVRGRSQFQIGITGCPGRN